MYRPSLAIDGPLPASEAFVPQALAPRRNWAGLASLVLSLSILAAIAFQIRGLDFESVKALVPETPGFWLAYVSYYLVGPASEWIIFRRLWRIPPSGFIALLRKLVSNELLLGYLGEVYFYTWARKRAGLIAAPFGAIKDVAVLSAFAGNIVTIIMLIVAWPILNSTEFGLETRPALLSLVVVLLTSLAIMLFRRRLFSLPRNQLRFVFRQHILRIVAAIGLAALMWHMVLPQVPLGWWLVLATFRMLISRLPFVPNKDVVFAGLAIFLLGHDIEIADLMTMMAGIILASHLAIGGLLGLSDIARRALRP